MISVIALGAADAQLLIAGSDVLSPGGQTWLVVKATVNNQDSVARTVTLYRVPSGGTAGATNIIVNALSIPAGETYALPISGQPVQANEVLHATASADNIVNLNIGYAVLG